MSFFLSELHPHLDLPLVGPAKRNQDSFDTVSGPLGLEQHAVSSPTGPGNHYPYPIFQNNINDYSNCNTFLPHNYYNLFGTQPYISQSKPPFGFGLDSLAPVPIYQIRNRHGQVMNVDSLVYSHYFRGNAYFPEAEAFGRFECAHDLSNQRVLPRDYPHESQPRSHRPLTITPPSLPLFLPIPPPPPAPTRIGFELEGHLACHDLEGQVCCYPFYSSQVYISRDNAYEILDAPVWPTEEQMIAVDILSPERLEWEAKDEEEFKKSLVGAPIIPPGLSRSEWGRSSSALELVEYPTASLEGSEKVDSANTLKYKECDSDVPLTPEGGGSVDRFPMIYYD